VSGGTSARLPVGTLALLLLLLLSGACSKVLPPQDQVIALEGATLIDGAGGDPKPDAVIIIRNGHIKQSRKSSDPIPRGPSAQSRRQRSMRG
jgi:hypothetical protein